MVAAPVISFIREEIMRIWLARLMAWLTGLFIVLLTALFAWLQN